MKKKKEKLERNPLMKMAEQLQRLRNEERKVSKKFIQSGRSQKDLEKTTKRLSEIRRQKYSVVIKGVGEKAEQLSKLGEGLTKKKLLKSPKAKVRVVPSTKLIKQFAGSGYTMFKSGGKNYSNENRSLLFQNEFDRERRIL